MLTSFALRHIAAINVIPVESCGWSIIRFKPIIDKLDWLVWSIDCIQENNKLIREPVGGIGWTCSKLVGTD